MTEVTPFYEKQVQCLLCKNSFSTTKIRSRFVKVNRHDGDFCPIYASSDINPLLYNINVCPSCGFSSTEDFNRYIVPTIQEELEEKISLHWTKQDYGKIRNYEKAINTYKLGAYCALIKREKKITIAGLYLRTAWLYRHIEKEKQEQRFLRLAVHEYIESYSTGDFQGTSMTEVKLTYLIAELLRRLEQYEDAARYLSKVLEKQKSSTEPKIIEMARNRWQEMRGAYKEALSG
jgi:uncharacterized protein